DLSQAQRLNIVRRFKGGKSRILIATDVASRGLHVEDVSHVINFDVPEDPENYVHRIGRTARAGQSGKAVMLACERYVASLPSVEQLIGHKIPVVHVEEGLLRRDEAPPYVERKRGGGPPRRFQSEKGHRRNSRSRNRWRGHGQEKRNP